MNWGRLMAIAMGTECAIAMAYYAVKGDWNRALYWLGCVVCYVSLAR